MIAPLHMMSHTLRAKVPYTPSLGEIICQHILEGKSVRQIEKLPGMPAARSVYRWLATNGTFRARYQLARELWAHGVLDEIRELVDGEIIPWPQGQEQQRAWLKRINRVVQAHWHVYHQRAPRKYRFLGSDSLLPAPVQAIEDISHEVVQPLRIVY